jgi:hypothetical protein
MNQEQQKQKRQELLDNLARTVKQINEVCGTGYIEAGAGGYSLKYSGGGRVMLQLQKDQDGQEFGDVFGLGPMDRDMLLNMMLAFLLGFEAAHEEIPA